jgi:hypothetical protein
MALERFNIDRFSREWDDLLMDVAGRRRPSAGVHGSRALLATASAEAGA